MTTHADTISVALMMLVVLLAKLLACPQNIPAAGGVEPNAAVCCRIEGKLLTRTDLDKLLQDVAAKAAAAPR